MGTAAPGTELAISTRGLRKTYIRGLGKRTVAVEGLDLDVPRGGVHGFLGPNGSGKTTTIRMLLGLIRADSGSMEIFGQPIPQALPDVIAQIGAIVESPKFFPRFSARNNLLLLAQAIGAPQTKVDEVLESVGLAGRAKDRYRTYSLGMKQRLAIASTLLKDPDLLIFDEPTNGLDPSGIHEVRETMRSLGAQGKTVLVSSHILSEIEQVADTVSIITRGRLLLSGRVSDLVNQHGLARVRVGLPNIAAGLTALTEAGIEARVVDDRLRVTGVADPAQITWVLAQQDLYVNELVSESEGLEQVFLKLTADHGPGATTNGAPLTSADPATQAPSQAPAEGAR